MRIAFLSTFYPFRGGIAQFNASLYKALEAKGNEVKAYTFTCQYPDFLFPGKTQFVTPSDQATPIDSTRVLDSVNPLSYGKTAKEIIQWKPDVLIVRHWMSFLSPSLGYVAKKVRKNGIKIICIIDNAFPHEPRFFDRSFTKFLFKQCDGFIVMSEPVKQDLLRIKPNAKYAFKPHPFYNHFGEKMDQKQALCKLHLDPDKKTLLFFGLIREYKGLDLLIDAMSYLDDSYQLLIAGECYGNFDIYEEQIGASPAKERIKAINHYIPDTKVPLLFSAADLLVLPYKSATQSGVIPVAYHFDTPVVATDVGGLRETLEPPHTGLICEPNAESIAQSVETAFKTGIKAFADNIEKEKKNLSWDLFADEVIKLAAEI